HKPFNVLPTHLLHARAQQLFLKMDSSDRKDVCKQLMQTAKWSRIKDAFVIFTPDQLDGFRGTRPDRKLPGRFTRARRSTLRPACDWPQRKYIGARYPRIHVYDLYMDTVDFATRASWRHLRRDEHG